LQTYTNDKLRLIVKDNGSGYNYADIIGENSTLGLQLVHGFIEQIRGELTFMGSAGSEFDIIFPILQS
jgi:two-component sensor histidine kinase